MTTSQLHHGFFTGPWWDACCGMSYVSAFLLHLVINWFFLTKVFIWTSFQWSFTYFSCLLQYFSSSMQFSQQPIIRQHHRALIKHVKSFKESSLQHQNVVNCDRGMAVAGCLEQVNIMSSRRNPALMRDNQLRGERAGELSWQEASVILMIILYTCFEQKSCCSSWRPHQVHLTLMLSFLM